MSLSSFETNLIALTLDPWTAKQPEQYLLFPYAQIEANSRKSSIERTVWWWNQSEFVAPKKVAVRTSFSEQTVLWWNQSEFVGTSTFRRSQSLRQVIHGKEP